MTIIRTETIQIKLKLNYQQAGGKPFIKKTGKCSHRFL